MDSPFKGSVGLGVLEKVSESRWTLQLAQAVFFADIGLLWWTGNGILEWSASTDEVLSNFGILIVHLLVFSILVSIVLPGLGGLLLGLVWRLRVYTRGFGFDKLEKNFPWEPRGYVATIHVWKAAIEENNSFLFGIYKDFNKSKFEFEQIAITMFSTWSLLCADYLAHVYGASLMGRLELWVTEGDGVLHFFAAPMMVLAFLGLPAPLIRSGWLAGEDLIYYPPIYEKLEEERIKRM